MQDLLRSAESGKAVTKEYQRLSLVPNAPAVYALYGGHGKSLHIAYVGVAQDLGRRIEQHLKHRNSSVTTGVSVVSVNPELVTEARWWQHPSFKKATNLRAAEIIAFEVLNPALRSRARVQSEARQVATDPEFANAMRTLFVGSPSGRLVVPTLQDALDRIAQLEQRFEELARRWEQSQ